MPDIAKLAGGRALLVEDNELNQEVASEFLRDTGLEVDIAANGVIALQMVQCKNYHIVLMDMQMPIMDGITATEEIRKLPVGEDLPIIAMTANAMPDDRERCFKAGMNDHLAKPIDPERLISKVQQWIRLPNARPGNNAPPPSLEALADIAGLDTALGLELVMGKAKLYLSLLGKFVLHQSDAPSRFAGLLAASDWDTLQREAHTLKGNAAQLGAQEIRQLAEQLEHAVRQREPAEAVQIRLDQLQGPLQTLLQTLSERLPKG